MSFFYPSPAAVARTRRARESMRSNSGSITRRAKDTSKSREEKSTPSDSLPTSHPSHPDFLLDSPHSAISSRTVTPTKNLAHHATVDTIGTYQLPSQLETPAALQQYLDREGLAELQVETSSVRSDAPTLVQSLPDLKATISTGSYRPHEHLHLVGPEAADSSDERTTHGKESAPAKSESPTMHASPMSLTEQPEPTRQRSHTPSPPHDMNNQSYSPPPYMSPIPVRAHPFTQPFLAYHGTPVLPFAPSGQPYTEMSHQAPVANPYFSDNTAHHQPAAAGHVQRTQIQEVAGASPRQAGRRPVSYTTGDEDVFSLVNRINSVLPDFHILLDRYEDTCHKLSGEPKSRRQSEAQLKDALREKDGYIGKLRRDIEVTHDEIQAGKERFEAETSKSQAVQRDLERSLLARTKSRDHLRERSEQLQRCYNDLLAHSKQTELALETFRSWVMQESSIQERSPDMEEKQNLQPYAMNEAPSISSPEPSVPGQFADSRGPSPLPLDTMSPSHAVHHTLQPTDYDTKTVDLEQLRNALAHETESAESQAWQQREMHLRKNFQRDRVAQARVWEEESGQLKQRWEQHQQLVKDQHEQEKAELHRLLEAAQTRHHTRSRELEDDNHDLRAQVEELKTKLTSERARRSRLHVELRAAALRVEHESRHLRHLMDSDESARPVQHITEGERGTTTAAA